MTIFRWRWTRAINGCSWGRKPARLLALNAASGEVVANLRACGDTDDFFYDSVNRKIYPSGGAGCVSIFDQVGSNSYEALRTIATPSGA
jgi:hypothetical protein